MKKKRSGCFTVVLIFFILFIGGIVFGIYQMMQNPEEYEADNEKDKIKVVFDASSYSRISPDDLIDDMGKPDSIEPWNYNGNALEIYMYDKNDAHYDFIIADNSVVQVSVYSLNYWTNSGERFTFKNKEDIPAIYGIELSENAKLKEDNSFTYKISPVNDKVAEIDMQDIDKDSNSYGFIKFTYNVKYFND